MADSGNRLRDHDGFRLRAGLSRTARVALAILFACAVFVRVHNATQPPVDFHPTRQYNGALLAHSFYVNTHTDIAPAVRAAATANRPPILEPPVEELFSVAVDDVIGHETLLAARFLSIAAWLVGGAAVFGIGRRLRSDRAGIAAAAIFELSPFAVVASRSFQPDPLGVGALAVALYLLVRYEESPTVGWLVAAAGAAAVAGFVKAALVPFLVVPFLVLAVSRGARHLFSARTVTYIGVFLAPAALWTVFAFGSDPGNYFIARFLGYEAFWRGVGDQLNGDFGIPLLAATAIGFLFVRGAPRRFLLALLAAYAIFAVAFDYRVATHSYYSLPGFILVALSGGVAVDAVMGWVAEKRFDPVVVMGVAAAALVGVASLVVTEARGRDVRPGVAEIARARAIGPSVCHDTHALMVAPVYGVLEQYYGDIGGVAWPTLADQYLETLQGHRHLSAADRLNRYRRDGLHLAIVTDHGVLQSQPDLAAALAKYPVVALGPAWEVYDLKPSIPNSCQNLS